MLDFVIFAVTFLAALIIAIIWLYPSSHKITTVPGLDSTSKDDGNLGDISRAGSLHNFLLDLHDQFGAIAGFWWGRTYVVSIASPELFKEHQNVFDKPRSLFEVFRPIFGPASIHFANGTEGRMRKRRYEEVFHSDTCPKYFTCFQKIAKTVVQKWSKVSSDDHVPVMEHASNFAFKSVLCTLLGEEFEDDRLVSKMKDAYEKAWLETEQHLLDPVALDEDSPQAKQIRNAMASIHGMIKEVVQAHKAQGPGRQGKKLIDVFTDVCPDETTLLSDTVTYISGAFQTSCNVCSWALYYLATNKDAQDKLFSEVDKILGESDNVNEGNFSDFRYLIQVIDETLRCAVVSPWTARVQEFDSELGGHKIPKNTPVIQALGVVLQSETIWSSPSVFNPDRFQGDNLSGKEEHSFSPFGFAGKRKCPGHKFAYWQTAVFLATLIQKFEISVWNDQLVEPVHGHVTKPGEEIWIKVVKR